MNLMYWLIGATIVSLTVAASMIWERREQMGNDDFSELIARLIISGVAIVLAVVALIYGGKL